MLLVDVLGRYAEVNEYRLHEYVVMPDHVHLLLTPSGALERTVQLIKGGYSFQAKRAFHWKEDIWQVGFTDHRIRDEDDWEHHQSYIRKNVESFHRDGYEFWSGGGRLSLAPAPQWLKPL